MSIRHLAGYIQGGAAPGGGGGGIFNFLGSGEGMFKNVAGQKVRLFAFVASTGLPKTGDAANLTAYLSKDYGTVTALGDTSATEEDATNAPGWYLFDVTQSESNCDVASFTGKSSTAGVVLVGRELGTRPPNFTKLSVDSSGRVDVGAVAGAIQSAANIGELASRLATLLEAAPGSPGEFRFTADALERSRIVLGLASGNMDAQLASVLARLPAALIGGRIDATVGAMQTDVLTASALATSAVTEIQSGLATSSEAATQSATLSRIATTLEPATGSPGEYRFTADALVNSPSGGSGGASASTIAAAVWDAALPGSYATGAAGQIVGTVLKGVADRLATMLESAPGSPGESRFTADAIERARIVVGLASGNLDAQLAAVLGRLPAALIGGRIDASVGAMAANTMNASALATDAVTEIQTGLATSSAQGVAQLVLDRLSTMLEAAPGSPGESRFTADALERVRIVLGLAGGNLDAQLAAALVAIASRASQSSVDVIDDYVDTEVAAIKSVTDKLGTTLEPALGSPGEYRFSNDALVNAPGGGSGGASAGAIAAAVWDVALPGVYASGRAGNVLGDTLKTVADKLTTMFEPAPGSPGEYRYSADALVRAPSGSFSAPSAAAIADAVWDEVLSGHTGAGSAGKAVGDSLDAAISTRATQASVNTVAGYVDTEVAAIKVVTDQLATMFEPASGSPGEYRYSADSLVRAPSGSFSGPSAGAIADAVWDESLAGHVGAGTAGLALLGAESAGQRLITMTEPALGSPGEWKLTPDALRAVISLVPTAVQNADALLDRDMAVGADSGSPSVRTPRQALRILRNKWSIVGTTQSIKKEDDSTESWSQVLTSSAGADPVTGTDPAGP